MRPAKLLRRRSREVEDLATIGPLVIDMTDTLLERNGSGLSAIQVGAPLRIVVLSLLGGRTMTFVNPRILERSGSLMAQETCLSIPGQRHRLERSRFIKVEHLRPSGLEVLDVVDAELAVALQHECDHLNGVLTLDRRIFRNLDQALN
jgi:peptide deformylase